MAKFHIIVENVAGKLDERIVDADGAELPEQVSDFVHEVCSLRDGDVIRIVEKEDR
ncbi:hypothetical protein [Bradyrhizobium sp. CB3481]|uniref:hypothetical protein n=1 Tax=Bradyrhizobium sp. CB3481 TaxID=3039158 RepID=UPI0024B1566C|nr:hypothetical protein [Bradyrhizobium sp. CB3481]WFU19450.1 hypothetical protein QA643_14535 [Bradyrhizobium sp. CB3481]